MPKNKVMLGSEHPLCDKIQSAMLILFFAVWSIDTSSHFLFRVSTVLAGLNSFPLLLFPALLSWGFGIYLASKSHEAVLPETAGQPRLIESGVYSWVRHPMYLGTLLFCLGFFFAMTSLLSLGVMIVFFAFYDKMATYEEEDLIHVLGEAYTTYQKRVPKWCPKPYRRKRLATRMSTDSYQGTTLVG
jgi:protein-S-isoprenylcysteine O-methyltransferase Ste14